MADGPGREADQPDNWWWFIVTTPDDGVHLYELGYAQLVDVLDDDGEKVGETHEVLSAARHDEIMHDLGAPDGVRRGDGSGWERNMSPGRPDAYLQPKAYTEGPRGEQVLLPIRARDGVTLHLHETSATD